MEKDKYFDKIVAALPIKLWNENGFLAFQKIIINDTIIATKKVLEAERINQYGSINLTSDMFEEGENNHGEIKVSARMVEPDLTFNPKSELGTIDEI